MGACLYPHSLDLFICPSTRWSRRKNDSNKCVSSSNTTFDIFCQPFLAFRGELIVGNLGSKRLSLCCTAVGNPHVSGESRFSDSGNGSYDSCSSTHQSDKERLFIERLVSALKSIQSVLPGGSWWKVHGVIQDDSSQISFVSAMQRFWPLVAPDKLIISVAFLALVLAAFSEIAIPHYVTATIFSAQSGLKHEFVQNAKRLAILSIAFGLFSGLRGGCFGVSNQILVRRMRDKLFSTMLNQDISFFDKEAVGILTSRLGSDCQQVSQIISKDLNIMLRNVLQGLGSLVYLSRISLPLALSTITICTIMWCTMVYYGKYQRVAARCAQDLVASANEVAEESLSLARVVRTFGTEKHEFARYSNWLEKLINVNLRQNVAYGLWNWSSNTLYNATQVIALMIGGSYVLMGNITAEQLTKFILYSEWVVHSTWWIGDHWASLMQAIGSSEKVFELMDLPPSNQLINGGRHLQNFKGNIQFKDVTFHYPTRPSVSVLRNVNLSIHPGEIVAVVGLSGSGKSTLVALLLRLYEPTSGEILIDNHSINELDVRWLRQQLGVVSQEPRLFSTDIASNISYGCERSISHTDIVRAAKQAHAHGFIMALPEGYKTVVDNSRLSGGQKQRIAIARALVRDPGVLVLDEATSALDAESEHFVQKALEESMKRCGKQKRTVLVIAHRLSTIRLADRIVVMRGGRISEVGSHDELLKLDGEYARLTRRQMSTL
ncbi:hypothetical protein GOP47_0026855 [Adiantum capillus-veneris]|nr:hypothetical protein GOP47_0026855 [Adiantum capillus-veneris]